MKKGKLLLLIALILGAAYMVYSFNYWGGAISGSGTDAEQAGVGIAALLVMPHIVLTGIAVIFNALGFFLYNRAMALVAGILYTVALVVFPVYFMFVVVEMILCFIAFALMKKE